MILYFIHVPRTGGNSIGKWIKTLGKEHKIVYDGHARYSHEGHTKIIKQDKTVAFTMMRDPVDITSSIYAYIKTAKPHRGYADAQKWSFSEWIVKSPEAKNFLTRWFNNHSWPQFINPKPQDLNPPVDVAVETLSHFNYIFDTATLTSDVNKMCQAEGIKRKFDVHVNGRKHPPITPEDIAKIKEVSSRDYEVLKQAAPHIKIRY